MITFLGGPADPKANGLCLRRAPLFLRVVRDTTYAQAVCRSGRQEWDALDQLGDGPRASEEIHVYQREGDVGSIHLNRRDARGRHNGGTFVIATYRHVEQQPPEDVVRDMAKWRAWCVGMAQAPHPGTEEV